MDDATFWDKAAAKYNAAKISDLDAYTLTLDRMRAVLTHQDHVLELGCGTGSTALELASGVALYDGTDFSTEMIKIANSKKADANAPDHLSFHVASADQPRAGEYTVVIALNLLHLMSDLDRVLAQVFDRLPSGGTLISKTVLMGDAPWYLTKLLLPVLRLLGKVPTLQIMSADDLVGALQRAGFVLDETLSQGGAVPRLFVVARKP